MENDVSVHHPWLKSLSAWMVVWLSGFGIHSWSEAAACAAFLYSVCLISEWLWNKFIRKGKK